MRGYGATAAKLTPDQKVGSSTLSALMSTMLRIQVAAWALSSPKLGVPHLSFAAWAVAPCCNGVRVCARVCVCGCVGVCACVR